MVKLDHITTKFNVMNLRILTFTDTLKATKEKLNKEMRVIKQAKSELGETLLGQRLLLEQLQELKHINKEVELFSAAVEEINFEIDKFSIPE